jgi:GxxExxY protein
MSLNDFTSAIIGAAIKVHRALGPGLLESAYQVCLEYELKKLGLHVESEKPIPVVYEEVKLECGFRADLFVQGQVIVECKAKEKRHPVDKAQVASHLRLTGLQVGLLINFHELLLKDGIQRIVNNYRDEVGADFETQRTRRTRREEEKVNE